METAAVQLGFESVGVPRELVVKLRVTDPEVIAELRRYPDSERERVALAALRLGVLSLRMAGGQVDAGAVKEAGTRLIADMRELLAQRAKDLTGDLATSLAQYFDPKSGFVPSQLDRMLRAHVGDESVLARTLAEHVGEDSELFRLLSPEEAGGLRAQVEQALKAALAEQNAHVLRQFSLDHDDSALSRLVRELDRSQDTLSKDLKGQVDALAGNLTLDDERSALSRLRRELMGVLDDVAKKQHEFQKDVAAALAASSARKQEAARSTTHGLVFEAALGERVAAEARRVGDVFEAVGATTGVIRQSKVGDHVVTLGAESAAPGARIVWEAKEDRKVSCRDALAEIDTARKNRSAGVGVFVFSRQAAPEELELLTRHGNDLIIVWDAEDPASDLIVRVAYSVARALSIRQAQTSAETEEAVAEIERATRAVEKQLQFVEESRRWAETIQSNGAKLVDRMSKMHADLAREVERLEEQLGALRAG